MLASTAATQAATEDKTLGLARRELLRTTTRANHLDTEHVVKVAVGAATYDAYEVPLDHALRFLWGFKNVQ